MVIESANSHSGMSLVVGLLTGLPVVLIAFAPPSPNVRVGMPAAKLGRLVNTPVKPRAETWLLEIPGAPWIATECKYPKRKLFTFRAPNSIVCETVQLVDCSLKVFRLKVGDTY